MFPKRLKRRAILQCQQLLRMPERKGRFAVGFLVAGNGPLEIVTPQIADRRHLDVFLVFERHYYAVELAAAIADTDVPQGDLVVRPSDARIRQRRAAQCRASGRHNCALSSVDFVF